MMTILLRRIRLLLLPLLLLPLLGALPATPARAATTFTVNSTTDPATGAAANCAPANAGTCTLRDAVAAANAAVGATITFSSSTNPNFILNSPLTLSASMTIQGNGAASTIVKASSTSNDVFDVTASGPVTLTGLAIAYGKIGVNITGAGGVMATADSLFGNATAGLANSGTATVTAMSSALFGNTQGFVNTGSGTINVIESTIANNAAGDGLFGGGISNSGTANVTRSTLSQNSTTNRYGGGIYNTGALTVTDSTLVGNTVSGSIGGGVANTVGGTVTVTGSTIVGNTAIEGGGIYCNGTAAASVKITNSTLAGNAAPSGFGGGIANSCRLTVTNSTLSANSSPTGGGLDNLTNPPTIVTNTLIVDSPHGGDVVGFTPDSTNRTGTFAFADPDPATPQDHGGPTKTLALPQGSPAIGAGDPAACAAAPVGGLEQRGQPRPATVCDIGAYETPGKALTVAALTGPGPNGNVPVTVIATDGFGGVMSGYRGTMHVSSTDPAGAPVSYQFTAADGGRHTFPSLFATAGGWAVTATDGALTGTGTVQVPLVVASISPSSGDVHGGGTATIVGANFGTNRAVVGAMFGNTATTVVQSTSTSITVRVPPHAAGTVDVTVTVNGVSATKAGAYTYGTVSPAPPIRPPSGSSVTGNPIPMPSPRANVVPTGPTPNPMPPSR